MTKKNKGTTIKKTVCPKIVCPNIEVVNFDFFGHRIRINKRYEANFLNAKLEIYTNYPYLISKITRIDSYNCRYIRNSESCTLSYHAFGQAIDINPNQLPSKINSYSLPDWVKNIAIAFKSSGFRWGADWRTLFDPMHFEIGSRVV